MAWLANKLKLTCTRCGREYPWSFAVQCSSCSEALLDVDYNLQNVKIGREGSPMQRYFDLLPILSRQNIVDAGEGNTPSRHLREAGKKLGLDNLYAKIEGENPTKSTKDRQGASAVSVFRDLGVSKFVTSSTGNSCTALARVVSRFPDMEMSIFVGEEFHPRVNFPGAPNVKIYVLKNATFVDAHEAAAWFARTYNITAERGFFFFGKREGLKTAYMEATEQVPRPIECYIQSISSAMGLYSTWRAAGQLKGLGLIQDVPKMVGVQEETCNPMVRAFSRGSDAIGPEDIIARPTGLSKATMRGNPSRVYGYVRNAVLESTGTFITATQDSMREMRKMLLDTEGLEICYTSAMTLAAAKELRATGWLKQDQTVLLNLTGRDRDGEPYAPADFFVERNGSEWTITPARERTHEDEAFNRVARVLQSSARLENNIALTPETQLIRGGLGLDSVGLLEYSLALESEFGCTISENHLTPEHFSTLGAVANLMRSEMSGKVSDAV
jgi:threonine synthase